MHVLIISTERLSGLWGRYSGVITYRSKAARNPAFLVEEFEWRSDLEADEGVLTRVTGSGNHVDDFTRAVSAAIKKIACFWSRAHFNKHRSCFEELLDVNTGLHRHRERDGYLPMG